MPPPPLQTFLRGAKSKSAPKRAPSVSAGKRALTSLPEERGRSLTRSRSHSRKPKDNNASGPIRPLSSNKDAPPPKAAPNKRPMAMLEEARRDQMPQFTYRERKQAFLHSMMEELKASWKPDSMAWVNLHVAGYYYTLDGVTHPRQLASCCLRLDSTQECRWSCWACNLNPAEAAAAGFSPSKSIWPSSIAQFYHWWTVHGKDSHWAWIYEAEEFDLTTREILQYLLAADLERWPFPWSSFALKALPREIPSRDGGHNPRLWQAPFHRKPTPLDAPSEMRNQTIATQPSQPAAQPKSNKPRSPPRGAISLTELGWTDPIASYSKYAKDELFFLLQPFQNLDAYGQDRIRWHQEQCPLVRITDFFLFIEQHSFFLLFIKMVSTVALQDQDSVPQLLREAVLGQNVVCPSQLKRAFHQGIVDLKMPVEYADYADSIHNYMADVLEIGVPVMGSTIPRPPAEAGTFPKYTPTPVPTPAATASSSSSSTSSNKRKQQALELNTLD